MLKHTYNKIKIVYLSLKLSKWNQTTHNHTISTINQTLKWQSQNVMQLTTKFATTKESFMQSTVGFSF